MRRTVTLLFIASALLLPAQAFAYINLNSEGGFVFDVADVSDWNPGSLSNGSIDAYDGCYALTVDGTSYEPGGSVTMTLSGRQLEFPEQTIGSLTVKRIVYVPTTGGDYARFLEVITNTSASAVTTTIDVSGNLGSDSGTSLTSTSSGDTTLTTSDQWFATDDSSATGGDPALGHVFQGTSAMLAPTTVSQSSDNIDYAWSVTVPAGGQVAFLHFAIQKNSREETWTEAMRLVEGPDDAMVGLDDYLDSIQNFGVATPGAPRVRFTGPFSAVEGDAIDIAVAVEDLEGDTYTFTWDLDGDRTFGDMPGATTYSVPAGTTDGPSAIRVGVEATDSAGNTSQRYRTVQITNADPRITSSPPLVTAVGMNLRYALTVEDPAGTMDAPTYSIVTGPSRMSITTDGVVQWTPTASDVTPPGRTITITVGVDDGDGGSAQQSWQMTVSPDRQPTPPTLAYPIDMISIADATPRLAVGNSEDLDLDPLTYSFEIDTVDTFDSPDLRQSGPIAEMAGFTSWQIEEPLALDRIYYWRVWSNDGMVDSEVRQTAFYLVRDPSLGPPDAGTPDAGPQDDGGTIPGVDAGLTPPSGGCSCRVGAPSSGSSSLWLLGLIGVALVLRRRR